MFKELLAQGVEQMGLSLTQGQLEQFARYHQMLTQAGRTMNLTRVNANDQESVPRHYLDSLTLLAHPGLLQGVDALADVGSGAGLPGLALAIALPQVRVTLIDALGKRVNFLEEVIRALGLNAQALHARCEDAGRDPALRDRFPLVTARAVADTPLLAELALPLVRPGGRLVCYKGPAAQEEAQRAQGALAVLNGRVEAILPAPIPGQDWDHRLLVLQKMGATPLRYPRKAGIPEKKPL